LVLLDEAGLQALGEEIDAARHRGFLRAVLQGRRGLLCMSMCKAAQGSLRKVAEDFPWLTTIIDRARAARDADGASMIPWLSEDVGFYVREVGADSPSTPGRVSWHGDWEHSTEDSRLDYHFDAERRAAIVADVSSRVC
jgi:hypothetical protein